MAVVCVHLVGLIGVADSQGHQGCQVARCQGDTPGQAKKSLLFLFLLHFYLLLLSFAFSSIVMLSIGVHSFVSPFLVSPSLVSPSTVFHSFVSS